MQASAASHAVEHATQGVLFGLNPVWVASIVFILTYLVVMTEKINRAIVASLGAAVMILFGILTQEKALEGVDFNTIGLLLGMMIIVAITQKTGVFQYVAIWSAKKVDARPWGILFMLSTVTAVFSALLDNVTTVLLISPIVLLITKELDVKPYPYLFTCILASNIGGAATLIGDPPNIMIGSAVGLSFMDFVNNIGPVALLSFIATLVPIYLIWRNSLEASDHNRERIMKFNEKDAIKDVSLLIKSLSVLVLVLGGFIFTHGALEPATIAMAGAALLLLLDNFHRDPEEQSERVHHTIGEAEWVTLFFFGGLFVLVYALEEVGVIHAMSEQLLALTGGDFVVTTMVVLWGSAILSALVDNIPFVATMIPLIQSMEVTFGAEKLEVLWWALSLGACFGGNGSLIGASANLVVAGFAERAGHPIKFLPFLLLAFPLMIISILISTVYIWFRYL